MMKTVGIVLSMMILWVQSSTCLAKDCTHTQKQIDVYLSRIENNLPILQQQASTLSRLLQNEKDLEKILQELTRFQGYTDLPGEQTPLYGELKPFKPNDDFILIGKNYIPLYSLEILYDLTKGGCYGSTSYDKALRDTTPQQWSKIASLMDKMLNILIPLNDIVVERIGQEDAAVSQEWRCTLIGERLVPYASCLYSVMFNISDSLARSNSPWRYYTNERERKRITKIMEKAQTPIHHLEMIQKYFRYLSHRRGEMNWEVPIATVDRMIIEMQEHPQTVSGLNTGWDKEHSTETAN